MGPARTRSADSLLVFAADEYTWVAVAIDAGMHRNRPTADLTIFYILLLVHAAINKQLDRLPAVGARAIN